MLKRLIIIFLIFIVSMHTTNAMQKSTSMPDLNRREEIFESSLNTKIHECKTNARVALEKALETNQPQNIALILDIDDTCILTKDSFNIIAGKYAYDFHKPKYNWLNPPVNEEIRTLSLWASSRGIKVFYLSARKTRGPSDQSKYAEELINSGYTNVENPEITLICQKHEEYRTDPIMIGMWKQQEIARIKETHTISFMVFLDDEKRNIDPSKKWQLLLPNAATHIVPPEPKRAKSVPLHPETMCEDEI